MVRNGAGHTQLFTRNPPKMTKKNGSFSFFKGMIVVKRLFFKARLPITVVFFFISHSNSFFFFFWFFNFVHRKKHRNLLQKTSNQKIAILTEVWTWKKNLRGFWISEFFPAFSFFSLLFPLFPPFVLLFPPFLSFFFTPLSMFFFFLDFLWLFFYFFFYYKKSSKMEVAVHFIAPKNNQKNSNLHRPFIDFYGTLHMVLRFG